MLLYFSYWGRNLTYAEILDDQSSLLLSYLLKGDMDPWMFHQPNLRAYDGVHSLLGDLLEVVGRELSVETHGPRTDVARDVPERQVPAATEASLDRGAYPHSPDGFRGEWIIAIEGWVDRRGHGADSRRPRDGRAIGRCLECGGHDRSETLTGTASIPGVRSSDERTGRKEQAPTMRQFARRGYLGRGRLPFVSNDKCILAKRPKGVKHVTWKYVSRKPSAAVSDLRRQG